VGPIQSIERGQIRLANSGEGFDFLGFHIQRRRKRGTNKRAVYTYPSKKALLRILDKVRVLTRRGSHTTLTVLLHRLNRVLRGWCNYFKHGVSAATFGYLDAQVSLASRMGPPLGHEHGTPLRVHGVGEASST